MENIFSINFHPQRLGSVQSRMLWGKLFYGLFCCLKRYDTSVYIADDFRLKFKALLFSQKWNILEGRSLLMSVFRWFMSVRIESSASNPRRELDVKQSTSIIVYKGDHEELAVLKFKEVSVLTLMWRPGSSSTSWRAMSLQVARALGVTFPSSSQYRLGEWANSAAGVACVTRVFVTSPVAFPVEIGIKMKPVSAN
jgi:hypothetical protein